MPTFDGYWLGRSRASVEVAQIKQALKKQVSNSDYKSFKKYIDEIPGIIARHGGKYIVQGVEPTPLEGEWRYERLVIIEFPGRANAEALLNDPDAQELFKIRHNTTTGRMLLADGCT